MQDDQLAGCIPGEAPAMGVCVLLALLACFVPATSKCAASSCTTPPNRPRSPLLRPNHAAPSRSALFGMAAAEPAQRCARSEVAVRWGRINVTTYAVGCKFAYSATGVGGGAAFGYGSSPSV
jgi:hypothetical protein